MIKQTLTSPAAAPAIGPYSPAVQAGDLVFFSGQVPFDASGAIVGATVAEQARQALTNLHHLLEAGALTSHAVVKTTIFLTDMNDFAAVNEVYGEFFEKPYPARSTVAVAALPKGALLEIEAIAMRE
ncbi:MAG TPA: Rid family detoxifying hydrolase [Thermoleophilia bacterium]|nr:Rid family detoxifying hydrolase [Thermoleophilia bacterium]